MDNTYRDPAGGRPRHPQAPSAPAGRRDGDTCAVPSRRTVLVSGLGGLAALAGCDSTRDSAQHSPSAVVAETHSFTSRARGGVPTTWSLLRPAHAVDDLPVVIALHGLHQDHGYPQAIGAGSALAAAGTPFALVAPDGGTSYWHPHDGEDAGAMVLDELLPRLSQHGLLTERIGLIGWSMGGYGVLRLAGMLGPARVAGVVAVSPALWTDPASASRSGFDGADEYRRYTVMGDQAKLDEIAVRVDCGRTDPFAEAVRTDRQGFARTPAGGFSFGNHDRGYWRRVLPAELAFLGGTLAG
jgi:S-formylglutathione hydrolase FrmB